MAIFRGQMSFDKDPYTRVLTAWIRDPRLSGKAKGYLAYILSHAEDYELTTEQMVREMRDGIDAVYTGLRELEAVGYLRRERRRNPDGTLGETDFFLVEPDDVPQPTRPGKSRSGKSGSGTTPGKSRRGKSTPGKTRRGESGPKEEQGLEKDLGEDHPPLPPPGPEPAVVAEHGQGVKDPGGGEQPPAGPPADAGEPGAEYAGLVDGLPWPAGGRPDRVTRQRIMAAVSRCRLRGHPAGEVRAVAAAGIPNTDLPAGSVLRRLRELAGLPADGAGGAPEPDVPVELQQHPFVGEVAAPCTECQRVVDAKVPVGGVLVRLHPPAPRRPPPRLCEPHGKVLANCVPCRVVSERGPAARDGAATGASSAAAGRTGAPPPPGAGRAGKGRRGASPAAAAAA